MIRVAIAGAAGRMGRFLVEAVSQCEATQFTVASERKGSSLIGCTVGDLLSHSEYTFRFIDDLAAEQAQFDLLIDFTTPEATLAHLAICQRYQKAIVIGTTGFSDQQKQMISEASDRIPIVFSPNYSVGVNLLLTLLEKTAAVMGEEVDIEIIEAHHRHKVDAPSGTALGMGESIAKAFKKPLSELANYNRIGVSAPRKKGEIGFAVVRAGDIVGEHTAIFADSGERLELTHKASSRMTFASGAVRASVWLSNQPAGLYTMHDVLALDRLT